MLYYKKKINLVLRLKAKGFLNSSLKTKNKNSHIHFGGMMLADMIQYLQILNQKQGKSQNNKKIFLNMLTL